MRIYFGEDVFALSYHRTLEEACRALSEALRQRELKRIVRRPRKKPTTTTPVATTILENLRNGNTPA